MFAKLKKSIISIDFGKSLITKFFSTFGALTLLAKALLLYFHPKGNTQTLFVTAQALLSFIIALVWAWPKFKIEHILPSTNSKISVKVGDLFKEDGHLVIGVNDVFDTEIGDIIKKTSIQGQFLSNVYNSDLSRLDHDIQTALSYKNLPFQKDVLKQKGKNDRYPIGTTIALKHGAKCYFLPAYSRMGSDLVAQSSPIDLWISLNELWKEVIIHGQSTKVSMGIVGSDLARINTTRENLITLIILSFVLAQKTNHITRELTIVVHTNDLLHINMVGLKDFIRRIK